MGQSDKKQATEQEQGQEQEQKGENTNVTGHRCEAAGTDRREIEVAGDRYDEAATTEERQEHDVTGGDENTARKKQKDEISKRQDQAAGSADGMEADPSAGVDGGWTGGQHVGHMVRDLHGARGSVKLATACTATSEPKDPCCGFDEPW